jgi:tetratricopeptide (TPR) repeat protein
MGGAFTSLAGNPFHIRVANAMVSYMAYMIKTIWPLELAVFYPHPGMLPIWLVSGSGLLLLLITFFSVRTVQKRPWMAVGWLWYTGTLVPVIGLVQVGSQSMADRYTYIPLIGLFIIIAWSVPELLSRLRRKTAVAASISSAVILILMTLTWIQVRYWKTSISLFEHALHVTPNNYIAHSVLGSALADQGRISEAVRHYHEALRINPGHATAHHNLGCIFARQGMTAEAIRHFTKSAQIDPEFAEAHNNLGAALANQGRFREAVKSFSEAVRINPRDAEAHFNLGNTFAHQGRITEAISHFSESLRINPDFVPAHNALGIVLAREGRPEEAIRHFSEALRIDPDHGGARNYLKWALSLQEE